ncbi:MAG: amidohydrolase family protein, partial [Solirubrobacteraceae bacterium]
MTRIDLHAHVITDAYRSALASAGAAAALPPASLDDLLAMMDRYAIDGAVISTGPPGAAVGDRGQEAELARIANEQIAECVRSEPGRLAGLAVLPLTDMSLALSELSHGLDVLALDGVMLLSNVSGVYLGDPAWDPLFDELDRRGSYVFVHPAAGPYPPPLDWP